MTRLGSGPSGQVIGLADETFDQIHDPWTCLVEGTSGLLAQGLGPGVLGVPASLSGGTCAEKG
jgi:hypothetical protein